jgi:hypothetical protein
MSLKSSVTGAESWKNSVSRKRCGHGPACCASEKLPKNGDYILAYRDPSGAPLEPKLLIDTKDKAAISEADIKKLIRDAVLRFILFHWSSTSGVSSFAIVGDQARVCCGPLNSERERALFSWRSEQAVTYEFAIRDCNRRNR